MFTDIVGFTKAVQENESSALVALDEHRTLLRPIFASHGGREIKTVGDAFLIEFPSALDATLCAIAVQGMLHDRRMARGDRFQHRIGIHVGDVLEKGGDILGDAVNIASRIEPLAEPGGICISEQVYDHVRNKVPYPMTRMPPQQLKNVNMPIDAYKVVMQWEESVPRLQSKSLTQEYPKNRIAILPFASFSSNPDDGFFADGVTDEIISAVAGISGLSVISRTSVIGYKGTTKKVKEIGKELEVGSILEGTFKKAGAKIRVTTQLIDVANDRHLWAQNYDRNLDDMFEVQSDVAKQVAEALRVRILSPELERIDHKPTENTKAYTLYLKGRYLWNKRGVDDLKQARNYFEQSLKEDPNMAIAYAGVADCCVLLSNNWGLDREKNIENAKAMLVKALELDSSLAEAHATRALVLQIEYQRQQAEDEFKKAIELKPSYATAHMWYSSFLQQDVRDNEAKEQIEKALELDPLSPITNENYGGYFFFTKRDYGKALELYTRAAELGMVSSHGYMAMAYGKLKMFDEMRRESAISTQVDKATFPLAELAEQAFFAWMEDDREKLRVLLPQVESGLAETGWNLPLLAMAFIHLNDLDKGFELLEKAYTEKNGFLNELKFNPFYDGIREDPRYFGLLKRVGLG